jgi:RNA polymerase sigma-70 factor (ECF subfamily)
MTGLSHEGQAAFRAFHDANHERILAVLTRMVGSQDAEDLAQVAFAKAAEAWPTFRGDADPSTWMHRIAINVALDHLRSRSARESKLTEALCSPETLSSPTADGSDPERELARKDVHACLLEDIGKLSETHREAFMLNALAGMNDDEIARMLGVSKGNVKVRLHRARDEFRRIVGARCDFYRNEFACRPSTPDCCTPADKKSGC